MHNLNDARTRAEGLIHTLQSKARDIWGSEAHGLRDARRVVDATLERVKANETVQRLRRGELDRVAGDSWHWMLTTLHLASREDIEGMGSQIKALNKQLKEINKKIESDHADN